MLVGIRCQHGINNVCATAFGTLILSMRDCVVYVENVFCLCWAAARNGYVMTVGLTNSSATAFFIPQKCVFV